MEGEFTDSSVDMGAQERAQQQNLKTKFTSTFDGPPTALFLKLRYEKMLMQLGPGLLEGRWDVLLAAFHPGGRPSIFRVSVDDSPASLVLGRHTAAALQVGSDSTLSLRHALVLLSRGEHGQPVVRLLDLSSSHGIQTVDGGSARSLAASGSLAVRAAETGLFVLYRADLERMQSSRSLPHFDALPRTQVSQAVADEQSVELVLRKSVAESMNQGGPYRSQYRPSRGKREPECSCSGDGVRHFRHPLTAALHF